MNCFWAASLTTFKALAPWLDGGGIVTLRYGLASVVCALLWRRLPGATPSGADLVKCLWIGALVFCIGPRIQTTGVQMGLAGDASVLTAFEPLLAAIAAAIVLGEHVAPRRWIGMACGMSGVILLSRIWTAEFRWTQLEASGLLLVSFVIETAYSVIGKPLLERSGALKVLAVALFAGTGMNLLWDGPRLALALPTLPASAWGMLLYLSLVCTVFGYGLWLVVIRETPVNVTALTIFIQPIAGLLIAMVWLHESAHWGQLWGIVAILTGLAIGLRRTVRFKGSKSQVVPPADKLRA